MVGIEHVGMRTAVLGTGFMGRVHLEALRRLGNVDSYSVTSRDESAVRAVMADPTVTAVHVCTPNASHVPLAKAALFFWRNAVLLAPISPILPLLDASAACMPAR